MRLVDEINVGYQGETRSIQLLIGDLTAIPASEAVDLLVVSAYPGSYVPLKGTLIGALDAAGVSVAKLAVSKAVDLREHSSCWLSKEIVKPEIRFKRILCFEPPQPGQAPEIVGDIFRSLIPFAAGPDPVSTIAMPIVASGSQGESREAMLHSLVRASMQWLSIGLPVQRIMIVERNEALEPGLRSVFAGLKNEQRRQLELIGGCIADGWRYDAFVSYARPDKAAVDTLVGSMLNIRGSLRLFVDQMELQIGAAWQQQLFEALDECRKVVTVLSPAYLSSKVCKEEYNIALFRHRETPEGVLLPVYLQTAALPTYMKLIQFEDAREGEPAKVAAVADKLVAHL